MTRDVAPRIKGHKPALIESRFFPALKVRGWSACRIDTVAPSDRIRSDLRPESARQLL